MRILDRPTVVDQPGQDGARLAKKAQRDKAGMIKKRLNRRDQWAKRQAIAGGKRQRRRSIFGTLAMIAGAECDGDESRRIADVDPTGETNFDLAAARLMRPTQRRRQGRRIVGDDKIGGAEQRGERSPRQTPHGAIRLDQQQFGGVGRFGGDHPFAPTSRNVRRGKVARMVSTISAAESSGRFNIDRSASGTASACNGVSMSPGSTERNLTSSACASLSQIEVRWRSAALLAP